MFRKTLVTLGIAHCAILLFAVAATSAQAQYRYGYGFDNGYGYGAGVGTSRYPRATFDDYFANRLRQRQIQQYYGTPYYPYYDDTYYGRQRQRTYLYRPEYDGRLFRSRHDEFHDRFDNRYDDYRDNSLRYRFGY